jgi:hypothetical protein
MSSSNSKLKVLECSSKGDKRFSSFYAKVSIFGKFDSIENHYQRCKRDANGNIVGKGKPVDHIWLYNGSLGVSFLTQFYRLLWIKYLDENPKLVEVLRGYDDYHDMFKGRAVNCQADVIRDYVRDRDSLVKSVQPLCDALRDVGYEVSVYESKQSKEFVIAPKRSDLDMYVYNVNNPTVDVFFKVERVSFNFYGYVWNDNCDVDNLLNECGKALESAKSLNSSADYLYVFIASEDIRYRVVVGASSPAEKGELFQIPHLDFCLLNNNYREDEVLIPYYNLLKAHFSRVIYNDISGSSDCKVLSNSGACVVKFNPKTGGCDIYFLYGEWPSGIPLDEYFSSAKNRDRLLTNFYSR